MSTASKMIGYRISIGRLLYRYTAVGVNELYLEKLSLSLIFNHDP